MLARVADNISDITLETRKDKKPVVCHTSVLFWLVHSTILDFYIYKQAIYIADTSNNKNYVSFLVCFLTIKIKNLPYKFLVKEMHWIHSGSSLLTIHMHYSISNSMSRSELRISYMVTGMDVLNVVQNIIDRVMSAWFPW